MRSETISAPAKRDSTRLDLLTIGALVLATVIVRVATLRTIDLGGDAAFKWFFVRSWSASNPWKFDHHTARFAINIPIWLSQRLLGTHPDVMYVAPLVASVLQVPLIYAIARMSSTRFVGVVACLLLLLFEPMVDASSQLLPGIFQGTYVLAASWAYMHFAVSSQASQRWLLAVGALLFVAYLSMVATVYFLPGFALAVWLVRRNARDAAVLLGSFAGLVALETAIYALFSSYKYGQFQIILATHTDVRPTTLLGLFRRYAVLSSQWRFALITCSIASCVLLARARRPALVAIALVPASCLLGMTFGVKHIGPLIPATDFSIRYFDVLSPFVMLSVCTAMWFVIGEHAQMAG
jgi:hypothetical protein